MDDVEHEWRVGTVCACNMNRSMAAHQKIQRFIPGVRSFGTNRHVKLPGQRSSIRWPFGTPYRKILEELMSSAQLDWYREMGIIDMLERNIDLKVSPDRWQDSSVADLDLVVCFNSRVFELVVEGMQLATHKAYLMSGRFTSTAPPLRQAHHSCHQHRDPRHRSRCRPWFGYRDGIS